MSNPVPLDLSAAGFVTDCEAGDNVNMSWISRKVDLAGWTLKFYLCPANTAGDGPLVGATPVEYAVTLVGGLPSSINLVLPTSATTDQSGNTLWGVLRRNDTGLVRSLSKGPIRVL